MPINGARGRGGGGAHPWHAPTTRRLVARCPGLLWEVLPGALGGQVGRIPSVPTTQGGGGNPQTPPGKPPGAHPNSTGHRFWQLRRREVPALSAVVTSTCRRRRRHRCRRSRRRRWLVVVMQLRRCCVHAPRMYAWSYPCRSGSFCGHGAST